MYLRKPRHSFIAKSGSIPSLDNFKNQRNISYAGIRNPRGDSSLENFKPLKNVRKSLPTLESYKAKERT